MLASLCVAGIGIGILLGRRYSYRVLLIVTPIVWIAALLALCSASGVTWQAFVLALGPVVVAQIAYFAGAQMRIEARGSAKAGPDSEGVAPSPSRTASGPTGNAETEGSLFGTGSRRKG